MRQHPPESDPQTFKRIRAAYEVLKDPRKRLEVDLLQPEIWPEETVPAKKKKAKASAVLDLGDVRRAVRAFTEISKRDFREDYQPVKLPS